jgi:hypothetical protein
MKRARYKEETRILPSQRWKSGRDAGIIFLLTALTLALVIAAPLRGQADPWPGNDESTRMTQPGQIFVYPREGQSPMRLDRDRYECHMWAMEKTGYDPSLPPLPVKRHVRVEPVPPVGHDTAFLGFTGALLGAIIGGHHHAPEGALIGGAIGAMTGLASDSARASTARRIEVEHENRDQQRSERMEARASEYRRAIGACLEGRGYSVK